MRVEEGRAGGGGDSKQQPALDSKQYKATSHDRNRVNGLKKETYIETDLVR